MKVEPGRVVELPRSYGTNRQSLKVLALAGANWVKGSWRGCRTERNSSGGSTAAADTRPSPHVMNPGHPGLMLDLHGCVCGGLGVGGQAQSWVRLIGRRNFL